MQTTCFTPSKLTLVVLLFASMLTLLGGAAVAPALPLISEAFTDANETMVSLIVTLPALTVAVSGFFIGAIADKIGKVKVLIASLLLFAIAGCSAFYLDSLEIILVGRVIVGLGIAGITSTTTALITSYYTGATRTKILGYQTAAMGFGILILEIGGGVLASISWRTAFLIYLLGAVALVGTVISMKEPPKYIPEKHIQTKEKLPVGKIAFIYTAVLLGFMFFYLIPTKYPYHLQSIGVDSVIVSGILLGIVGFIGSCIGVFYWRIAGHLPRLVLAAASSIFLGIGFLVVGFTDTISLHLIGLICMGLGNGLLLPTMISWLSSLVPPHQMGAVSGGYGAAINIGSFISSLVAVPILAVVMSYGNMFATFGGIAIAIGIVYLIMNVASKKFDA